MLTRVLALGVSLLSAMPMRTSRAERTKCEEFAVNATFNPRQVVDSRWKIFYYWGDRTELKPIVFSLPAKKEIEEFKRITKDMKHELDINWSLSKLIMMPKAGIVILLVEKIPPVTFHAIRLLYPEDTENETLKVSKTDIVVKDVGLYMGIMACEEGTAYALARIHQMPQEQEIEAAAKSIGFNGPGGKSYLENIAKQEL